VYRPVASHYIPVSFVRPAGHHTMITLEERTGFFFIFFVFFSLSSFLPAAPSVSRSSLFPGFAGTPANIQTFQPFIDQEKSGGPGNYHPSNKPPINNSIHCYKLYWGGREVAANDDRRFANITHLREIPASNKAGDARCPSFFFLLPPLECC